jgi:hypothetical protein
MAGKIDELLRFIGDRRDKIHRTLGKGSYTPIQIVRKVFPNQPREGLFRAVSDVMGHLEILEEEGLVEKTDDRPVRFRLSKVRRAPLFLEDED